jgi:SET domain-containing protein
MIYLLQCSDSCRCSNCQNRFSLKYRYSHHLEVFQTGTKGWGVRTTKTIEKGTYICEYTGEVISEYEANRRGEIYDATSHASYLYSLTEHHTVDADKICSIARFLNHSCVIFDSFILFQDPNCISVKVAACGSWRKIIFYSKKKIPKGTELTLNYLYRENKYVYNVECLCGSKNCNQTIGLSQSE